MNFIKQIITCSILFFIFISCDKDNNEIILESNGIAVFGGSLSSLPESEAGKRIWRDNLNIQVTTHGIGGAGFSTKTQNNVIKQIKKAPAYDVYVLWASTNDINYASVGTLESTDITTQSGAIKECFSIIKSKNKDAQIFFFTSLPLFSDPYKNVYDAYIENQIKLCELYNITYFDQSTIFNYSNFEEFYSPDLLHLNTSGYLHIAPMQSEFLLNNINWTKINTDK